MEDKQMAYVRGLIRDGVEVDTEVLRKKMTDLIEANEKYGDESYPLCGYANIYGGFDGCIALAIDKKGRGVGFKLVLFDKDYKVVSEDDIDSSFFLAKDVMTMAEDIHEQIGDDEDYLNTCVNSFNKLKNELEKI